MQFVFMKWRRFFTGNFGTFQTVCTPPYTFLFITYRPYRSAVRFPTAGTKQQLGECIACVISILVASSSSVRVGASPCKLQPNLIPCITVDYCLMTVLYKILWLLTVVYCLLMCQTIHGIPLLKNSVTDILFVTQYRIYIHPRPVGTTVAPDNTTPFHFGCDILHTVPISKGRENISDSFGFFLNDMWFTVITHTITKSLVHKISDLPFTKATLYSPCYISADGFTFSLSKGRKASVEYEICSRWSKR